MVARRAQAGRADPNDHLVAGRFELHEAKGLSLWRGPSCWSMLATFARNAARSRTSKGATAYLTNIPTTPENAIPAIVAADQEAQDALPGLWGPPCNGNTTSVPR